MRDFIDIFLMAGALIVGLLSLISLVGVFRCDRIGPVLLAFTGYLVAFFALPEIGQSLYCALIGGCREWGEALGGLVVFGWLLLGGTLIFNLLIIATCNKKITSVAIKYLTIVSIVLFATSFILWQFASVPRNLSLCWSFAEKEAGIIGCSSAIDSPLATRMDKVSAYEGRAYHSRYLPVPDYEGATRDLQAALKSLPDNNSLEASGFWVQLAQIELVHNQRLEVALTYLNKAIEIQPHNRSFLTDRSTLYTLMGKFELATKDIEAAAAPSEVSGRGLLLQAVILAKSGKTEAALRAMQDVSVLNFRKEHPEWALFEGSQVYRLTGKIDTAFETFVSFVEIASQKKITPSGETYTVYGEQIAVLEQLLNVPKLVGPDGKLIPEVNGLSERCFRDDTCYEKMMSGISEAWGSYAEFRFFGL